MSTRFRTHAAVGVAVLMGVSTLAACSGGAATGGSAPSAPSASELKDLLSWEQVTLPERATPELADGTYTLDLGNGQTAAWEEGEPLKVAVFLQGQSNTFLTAYSDAITQAAGDLDVEVTMFDGAFDPNKQLQQMQNAATSGEYNAAIAWPITSDGTCKMITETLPAAGVPVLVTDATTCGRENSSPDLWAPGTIAQTGLDYSVYHSKHWEEISSYVDEVGEPTKAIYVLGTEASWATPIAVQAARDADAANDNLEVVGEAYTDFTNASALEATQNLLNAHPDVNMVVIFYGGQVQGAVQALTRANILDKVKIATTGGSADSVPFIEDGTVVLDIASYPATEGYCAVDMLASLWGGNSIPRYVPSQCHVSEGSPDEQNADLITPDNVADFRPQY